MRGFFIAALLLAACSTGKETPQPSNFAAGSGGGAALSLSSQADTAPRLFVFGQDTVTVSLRLSERKTDTVYITRVDTVPAPLPSVKESQVFGPSGLNVTTTGVAPYTWTTLPGGSGAAVLKGLSWAVANKVKVKVNIPGGSHAASEDGTGPNLSIINGVLQFDSNKWKARTDAVFSAPGVKDSLLKYWGKGLVVAIGVMDEPHVYGTGDGNTWGPKGTMTKARVDSLCQYVKDKIPSIPVGPDHQAQAFEPDKNYRVCDFVLNQWSSRTGDRKQWAALSDSIAKRQGTQILYAINWQNGGTQDKDGTWDCKDQGGVKGQYSPNCAMTPDTVKAALLYFARKTAGGLMMWSYDANVATKDKAVAQEVAESLKSIPFKPLKRR